jgi:acyl-CoA reductase-like NAD-dependent aldehyde dehydrogenase
MANGSISAGSPEDVDRAVAAARDAFTSYSQWSVQQRIELLEKIRATYKDYFDDIAQAISDEMGAPIDLARGSQAKLGHGHIKSAIKALLNFPFETIEDDMILRYEPIGVCGMITPWNWPMNQVAVKVMPALAAGCTMVLKPSEESPLDAMIFTEVLREAGVPAGVFNLVNGYGPVVGREGGCGYGQACRPGARRQVAQYYSEGCRHRRGGHRGRSLHDGKQRPVLQRTDAHAGAERRHGAGDRGGVRRSRKHRRR